MGSPTVGRRRWWLHHLVAVVLTMAAAAAAQTRLSHAHPRPHPQQHPQLVLEQSSSSSNNISAYEQLERNGFPAGLLPRTVVSYTLQSDGRFAVYLSGKCSFTVPGEKLPVSYSSVITGVLAPGRLSDLGGVQVKVLWIWWSITGIYVKNDNLVFEVGLVSAEYPMSNFDEGLECDAKKAAVVEPGTALPRMFSSR